MCVNEHEFPLESDYRIALGIEYKGTQYRGWQSQMKPIITVQDTVEKALSQVANKKIQVVCAGRTDAQVHASNQVVHFDTSVFRSNKSWIMGANANLPSDISIIWAKKMDSRFHARFSATQRRYRYIIYNDPIRPAHLSDQITWNYRDLDFSKMQQASLYLIGRHDFSSFRASHCQAKSPIKTISELKVYKNGKFIVLDISADAFLHHMVRNIAGVLMSIGSGLKSVDWMKQVLEAQDRAKGGVTAPPYGLYLVDVCYPKIFDMPKRYIGPNFLSYLDNSLSL